MINPTRPSASKVTAIPDTRNSDEFGLTPLTTGNSLLGTNHLELVWEGVFEFCKGGKEPCHPAESVFRQKNATCIVAPVGVGLLIFSSGEHCALTFAKVSSGWARGIELPRQDRAKIGSYPSRLCRGARVNIGTSVNIAEVASSQTNQALVKSATNKYIAGQKLLKLPLPTVGHVCSYGKIFCFFTPRQ